MPGCILVADDEKPFARLISRVLCRRGFDCRVAEPVDHLPRLYDETRAQLLVIDWLLNGRKTGIDRALELRDVGFRGPVILVSGVSEARLRIEQRRLDRCWILPKPFAPSTMVHLADRLIRNGNHGPDPT
ncbi:MAG: response regulator [Phycisphaeraceae bacterium]|nr:response regulator [Phycisphaeraceae bacterium]